jgi:hypothetical protein
MKAGDLYRFTFAIPYVQKVIGIFLKQEWDGDGEIYEFYFPLRNSKLWFRQSELNYAKRLTQENR